MPEITGAIPPKQPKRFPFVPDQVSTEELTRMELMLQLNMWANNNPTVAKQMAITLISVLMEQFDIAFEDHLMPKNLKA